MAQDKKYHWRPTKSVQIGEIPRNDRKAQLEKVQKKTNNFLHELKKSTTTAAAEANNSTPHDPHPSWHHLHNGILDLPQYSSVQR